MIFVDLVLILVSLLCANEPRSKFRKNLFWTVGFISALNLSVTSLLWWVAAVSTAALWIATVAGNAAVLTALTKIRRAPAHYPLASLATADLLLGLCVLPLAAARELFVFQLNQYTCACWSALDVLCCTASILSLCTLGWERYSGITAPLARARRAKHARRYAVAIWPVAVVVALPTVIVPSQKHGVEVVKACIVNTNIGYVVFSTFFSFYVPAALMLALYAKILCSLAALPVIRAHQGKTPCDDVNNRHNEPPTKSVEAIKLKIQKVFASPNRCHLNVPGSSADKNAAPVKNSSSAGYIQLRQKRATRTIVMLMSLFLICWTPFFIMLPIDSFCECVWDLAWQCCTWLGYMNSALNPIVYAAASPSVRRALYTSFTSNSSRSTDLPLSSSPRNRMG